MTEVLTTSEYARKRREGKKSFNCLIDAALANQLEEILYKKRLSKKDWLIQKITEEIEKDQ